MIKKLILKDNSGLPLDANKYQQLENYCQKFLCSDEMRFVGVLNNMGNLIAGGFKEGTDPMETDEKRRMQYMQIVFDIAIRKEKPTIKKLTQNKFYLNFDVF